MNKKVLMQVGCFLTMFVLEMIAAYVDPASALCNILLVLSLLMIPVFVIIGRTPEVLEHVESTESTESLLAKAA